jgi:hypothetical protein
MFRASSAIHRVARHRFRRLVAVALAGGLLGLTACTAPFKDAAPDNGGPNDHGWFEAGRQWVGDFGDPHIVQVGGTYFAYSSPTGGRYLPVLSSTDLRTWTVHPNWSQAGPPGHRGYNPASDPAIPAEIRQSNQNQWDTYNLNDGLVSPPAWGLHNPTTGPWVSRDLWAPGVIQIGATWYAYSAVRTSWYSDDPNGYGRFCLTVASAPSPWGPFRDISGAGPIQCQPVETDPAGSIDPFPFFYAPTGKYYLLWKAAGMVGVRESALMAVELGGDGKPVPGAPWVRLLETFRWLPWEGGTIENPGMIFNGRMTYLFYSANSSNADANGISPYATGYAMCFFGPTAPCVRPQLTPLMASAGLQQGPGGSAPFFAADGSMKLAYATFWAFENRFPQPRRLHIGNLATNPDGYTLSFAGDV